GRRTAGRPPPRPLCPVAGAVAAGGRPSGAPGDPGDRLPQGPRVPRAAGMSYLHQIDPIAIPLPFWPHGVHWYGLMYLAGFLLAWWLGARRIRAGHLAVSEQAFGDLMFYAMLGVVLGGRLGYILFYNLDEFLADPVLVFRINEGGMSFHGGLLGVMGAVAYWSWRNRLQLFDAMDFIAPLVPPGLGFGRLGNFIG